MSPPQDSTGAGAADDSVLAPGQLLGRYRVLSLLGAGGMGQVYLAEDPRLGRRVALKLLPATLSADPERLRRFEREARAASALSHPNVCVVHEIGETDDGRRFIAMEHVPGESLRERLIRHRAAGTRIPADEAVDIARQAAAGLAAAHAAGVVHRDVKPENLMIRPDGLVKVLDFGLAKRVEREARPGDLPPPASSVLHTEPGMVLGTLQYMSPEQTCGLPVDAPTDVWSLGVVLYEMLAGRPPFDGATTSDVMVAVLDREPPPLATLAPELPVGLEATVLRALSKEPAHRHADATELYAALNGVPRDATAAMPPSAPPGATDDAASRELSSRHAQGGRPGARFRRLALGATALLTLAALGYTAWTFRPEHGPAAREVTGGSASLPRSLAVLPLANVGGDTATEYFADGMTDELTGALARLPGLKVVSRTSASAFKGKRDVDVREVARRLGVGAVLEGSVRKAGNQVRVAVQLTNAADGYALWSETYDRELADIFAVQNDVSRSVVSALQVTLAADQQARLTTKGTRDPEAFLLRLKASQTPYTPAGIQQSIELLQQAITRDPTYADAHATLATTYALLGSMDVLPDSVADARGMAAVQRALQLDQDLPQAHLALAFLLGSRLDIDGAGAALRRALELKPSDPQAHNSYAMLRLVAGGLTDEVLREQRLAEQLDPMSAAQTYNLGIVLLWMHREAEAVDWFRKAMVLDPTDPGPRSALGVALARLGRDAEAMEAMQQALSLVPDQPEQLADLAYVHARGGRPEKAREILARLQRAPSGARPWLQIAMIHSSLGARDAAFESLARVSWDSFGLIALRGDLRLESVRSDPRYQELLRKLGLH